MRLCGSRPAVGSSRNRICGRCMIARATISRWAMPPDRAITGASARSARRTLASSSSVAALACLRAHAEVAAVEVEVLGDRHRPVERVGLRHDADHLLGQRRVADDVDAADLGRAARRGDPGGEHADGRALAGAVRAEEAVDLAGADLHVEVDHGVDVARVGLVQLLGRDDRRRLVGHGGGACRRWFRMHGSLLGAPRGGGRGGWSAAGEGRGVAGVSRARTSASVASATASSSARRSAPAGVRSTRTTRRSPVSRRAGEEAGRLQPVEVVGERGRADVHALGQLAVGRRGAPRTGSAGGATAGGPAVDGQALVEPLAGLSFMARNSWRVSRSIARRLRDRTVRSRIVCRRCR